MSEVIDIVKKTCTKCGEEKIENIENFRIRKQSGKYISQCRECLKKDNSKYHKLHNKKIKYNPPQRNFPEEKECTKCGIVKKLNKDNYHYNSGKYDFTSACKSCVNKQNSERYEDNLKKQGKIKKIIIKIDKNAIDKICTKCGILKNIKNDYHYDKNAGSSGLYDAVCKTCVNEYNRVRLSTPENKIKKAKQDKAYRANNNDKLKEQRQKKRKEPKNKIRHSISSSILKSLKLRNKRKNGSISDYLSYSIDELVQHIESQFESWMTWKNQGVYNPNTWDDNDSSTWVWNIDHIIPHSDFEYESMEDEEFKKCWALSNLRPYSAKQNIIDGTRRVRHIKKRKNKLNCIENNQ